MGMAHHRYDAIFPTVWGGNSSAPLGGYLNGCSGHLFGFSGLSGPTNETAGFVSVATVPGYSLSFCALSKARNFTVHPGGDVDRVHIATGDVLVASSAAGSTDAAMSAPDALKMAWVSKDRLAGTAPAGTILAITYRK